jgi:hypothetical protein
MIEAEFYNNDIKEYETYYFEDLSELTDFLMDNNVTLIKKTQYN